MSEKKAAAVDAQWICDNFASELFVRIVYADAISLHILREASAYVARSSDMGNARASISGTSSK